MGAQLGVWHVGDGDPVRVERSRISIEADLEDWCERHPSLLAEGLTVVARQVRVAGGLIDLLGVDAAGRWVVVELKRGRLHRDAVAQALDYAACLVGMDVDELRNAVSNAQSHRLRDPAVRDTVETQLEDDEAGRDVAIIVAGTGVDASLERLADYLTAFDVPLRAVSFEVFQLPSGEQMLIREVVEEEGQLEAGRSRRRRRTVDDFYRLADVAGVGDEFRALLTAAQEAGLFVRPFTHKVTITPASHHNRYLMTFQPDAERGIRFAHAPETFAEFFDGLSAQDVVDVLGDGTAVWHQSQDLQQPTATVVGFLAELPEEVTVDEGRRADRETIHLLASLVRPGEWTTYGDLSTAAIGRSSAAMAVGNMARMDSDFPNPHRVLALGGKIPSQWRSNDGQGPEECRRRLGEEGIRFLPDGRANPEQQLDVGLLEQRAAIARPEADDL